MAREMTQLDVNWSLYDEALREKRFGSPSMCVSVEWVLLAFERMTQCSCQDGRRVDGLLAEIDSLRESLRAYTKIDSQGGPVS